MGKQRWFGREPALVLQSIAALLALLIGFQMPGLNDVVAAAIMAVLTAAAAAWTALHVRPLAPTLFGGLIIAAVTLLSVLGLHISQQQTGSVTAFVAVLIAMLTRPQQDYLDPIPTANLSPPRTGF